MLGTRRCQLGYPIHGQVLFVSRNIFFHALNVNFKLNCYSVFFGIYLTLKAPITTAADDIHKYFFIVFQRK